MLPSFYKRHCQKAAPIAGARKTKVPRHRAKGDLLLDWASKEEDTNLGACSTHLATGPSQLSFLTMLLKRVHRAYLCPHLVIGTSPLMIALIYEILYSWCTQTKDIGLMENEHSMYPYPPAGSGHTSCFQWRPFNLLKDRKWSMKGCLECLTSMHVKTKKIC